MPVIKLSHNGLTAGIPPMNKNHNPPKRGDVSGWSEQAAKNNIKFLRSIPEDSITGHGYAFTLTIRDCPPTPKDWHKLRRAFIERLRRRELIRLHWVTEWQRRGVPHLHGIAFFPDPPPISGFDIVQQWLKVAEPYYCLAKGQHVKDITDVIGWFKYLSKHAARGHLHYQRNSDAIPEHWKKKTGRVWGYLGDWDKRDPMDINIDNQGFYRFRRLVRSWRVADARSNPLHVYDANGKRTSITIPDVKRIKSARSMLKCSKPDIARLRGVSEWIPLDLGFALLAHLKGQGHDIES